MLSDSFITYYFSSIVFVFGACIGSFLNVVIYRLPKGESVVTPRSHCSCGAFIAWYDNIPVLSWFVLRGKCRKCQQPYSFRYPFIELSTGLLFLACWDFNDVLGSIAKMLFVGMMIPAAMIDLDTMEIPDRFSIGGFILGIIVSLIIPTLHLDSLSGFFAMDGIKSTINSFQGAFVGSGLILWLALVAELILKKEAMGFGDVKLMGAIGAFCGWQGAIFSLFGGAVIGCFVLIIAYPFMRKKNTEEAEASEDNSEGLRIPFGPALVAGAFVYILFVNHWVDAYFLDVSTLLESLHVYR